MDNDLKYEITKDRIEAFLSNDSDFLMYLNDEDKKIAEPREKITDSVRDSVNISELAEKAGKSILEYLSRCQEKNLIFLQRKKIKLENEIYHGKTYKKLFLRDINKRIAEITNLPKATYHDYGKKCTFDYLTDEVISIESLLDEGRISFRQRDFLVRFVNSKEISFIIEGNSKFFKVILPEGKKNKLNIVEHLFEKMNLEEIIGTSIKNLTFKPDPTSLTKKI